MLLQGSSCKFNCENEGQAQIQAFDNIAIAKLSIQNVLATCRQKNLLFKRLL